MRIFFLTLLTSIFSATYSQISPDTKLWSGDAYLEMKKRIQSGDTTYSVEFKNLIKAANDALQQTPLTVMAKEAIPPSGDKHDFMSMGPYWWPDPGKPDGLPYIRKDGERNPETKKLKNDDDMNRMNECVEALALAFFYTDDEKYAEHAVKLLRVWFLEEATRMNPNLNFGQSIPGICTGRGIGIIDTHGIIHTHNSIALLFGSKAWTSQDQAGMVKWFEQYLTWMLESPNGKDEYDEHNNHGTWYDVQTTSMALFTGKKDLARKILENSKTLRLNTQIKEDGSQPFELARTKSWGYSSMNLQAMFHLARFSETVGLDLWNYTTPNGAGIKKALDYLMPYANGEKEWTKQQLGGFHPENIVPLLIQASAKYKEPKIRALILKLNKMEGYPHLLYP